MKFEVSAPGKVILHGEHAVVYGKTAIAASLSLRTHLTLASHAEKVKLDLKNLGITKEWDKSILNDYFLQSLPGLEETAGTVTSVNEAIIEKINYVFGLTDCQTDSNSHAVVAFLFLWIYVSKCYNNGVFLPCTVEVESELGIGAGMGSSASYSVCLATSMLVLCGRTTPRLLPEDKQIINEWAFQAERIFHGKPSGLDNAVCLYGGAVLFQNGSVSQKIPNLPNIHVLLVDTKVSRNTKLLVEKVKQKKILFPGAVESIMDSIDYVSIDCWKLLMDLLTQNGDRDEKLQMLIETNHHLLNALGVGHPMLDKIHTIASQHACVSKTTGAGGGGCALVLIPQATDEHDTASLMEELKQCDFDVHDVFLGCPGVQVEFQTV